MSEELLTTSFQRQEKEKSGEDDSSRTPQAAVASVSQPAAASPIAGSKRTLRSKSMKTTVLPTIRSRITSKNKRSSTSMIFDDRFHHPICSVVVDQNQIPLSESRSQEDMRGPSASPIQHGADSVPCKIQEGRLIKIVPESESSTIVVKNEESHDLPSSKDFDHGFEDNIRFDQEEVKDSTQNKPYVLVTSNSSLLEVSDILISKWDLECPKIVLSVISNATHYKQWTNQRLNDDFQKGLIKAATATDMWIITNGSHAGVTKIIGDAVREFNLEQQDMQMLNSTLACDVKQNKKQLHIIGITHREEMPGTTGVSAFYHTTSSF